MLLGGRAIAVLACALALSGCITPPDFDTGSDVHSVFDRPLTQQAVRFVTTRCSEPLSGAQPGSAADLLSKRCWDVALQQSELTALKLGVANGPGIHCGSAMISVIGAHPEHDARSSLSDFQANECDAPFAELRAAIAARPCKCALIFVHGFNTTLPYALKRMGQLALDLDFKGVPILFSFGASGRLHDYVNDTEAAELAAPALQRLFVSLSTGDGAGLAINVLAHSMGTRLTLRAIAESDAPRLNEVVMAAPDLDPAAFLQLSKSAVEAKPPRVKRLTVYTSEYDTAMDASIYQHNGRDRLGSGLGTGVSAGLERTEVVNASNAGTKGYGHSYFAQSQQMIADIKAALNGDPIQSRAIVGTEQDGFKIPCPEGQSCAPSLYERAVRWLTKLLY